MRENAAYRSKIKHSGGTTYEKATATIIALVLLIGSLAGCAQTQAPEQSSAAPAAPAFPGSTINIINPWAAGGAVDLFARQIATEAEKIAGLPIIVENNTGASGTIGVTQYLDTPDDGHSVLFASAPVIFWQPYVRDITYAAEDFSPIIGLHKADPSPT